MSLVTVVGSGSKGNCSFVYCENKSLLIDCGMSMKEINNRLHDKGMTLEGLEGILITHAHQDHCISACTISNRLGVPIYMLKPARELLEQKNFSTDKASYYDVKYWEKYEDTPSFIFAAFPVIHDSPGAAGYIISPKKEPKNRITFITDTGSIKDYMVSYISGSTMAVIEANHDTNMLRNNKKYPQFLKERISGQKGHLNNNEAMQLVSEIEKGVLKHVVFAHTSQENNTEELIYKELDKIDAEVKYEITFEVATQEEGSSVYVLE